MAIKLAVAANVVSSNCGANRSAEVLNELTIDCFKEVRRSPPLRDIVDCFWRDESLFFASNGLFEMLSDGGVDVMFVLGAAVCVEALMMERAGLPQPRCMGFSAPP